MRLLLLAFGIGLVALSAAWAGEEPEISAAIRAAVEENPYRTPEQMARDRYRHPAKTLAFFEVGPKMTIAEPLPGWYTEILGALLRDRGHYIAINLPPRRREGAEGEAPEKGWRERFMERYGTMLGPHARAAYLLSEEGFAPAGSVDRILAFRAFHGWVYAGVVDRVLAAFYRALKPGGILGIVQHRENEDSPHTPADRRGYLKQSFVIKTVEAAGFRLAGTSETNANPKDTKDYDIGVWALPPTLRVDDVETRRAHVRIGESDRMTLKFVKPAD
ncbi:MAG: class I SAM-dependent methyltransferase [Rhodothalassiaceae bacterium]